MPKGTPVIAENFQAPCLVLFQQRALGTFFQIEMTTSEYNNNSHNSYSSGYRQYNSFGGSGRSRFGEDGDGSNAGGYSSSSSAASYGNNYSRGSSGSFRGGRGGFLGSGSSGRPASAPVPVADWSTLPPLTKNFYHECAEVAAMTESECQAFRREHEMTLQGQDIPKPVQSFSQVGFPKAIERKLADAKFDKPTPIQAQGWPMALSGRNMVGIAQTGSGKTLSYILPALVHIAAQPPLQSGDGPIALVLAPTRELACQIEEVARTFGSVMRIRNACLYGGAPKGPQIRQLRYGAEIVVATPGRLIDLINMGCTNLNRVSFLILDEADRMLDMGFEPQLRDIIPKIRPDRQVTLWSATWPKEVQRLARDLLGRDFIQVTIGSTELTANKKIRQVIEVCEEADKEKKLADLMLALWNELPEPEPQRQMMRTIIFANKKRVCEELSWKMRQDQWPCAALHGDKSQQERDRALADFKHGYCPILVCTDVAARGLDVKDVRVVINFDFPVQFEDYVHRIGRTARGSATEGRAYTFFTRDNRGCARDLIALLKDSEQEVPPALMEMAPAPRQSYPQNRGRFGYGGGRGGRGGYGGYGGGRGGFRRY